MGIFAFGREGRGLKTDLPAMEIRCANFDVLASLGTATNGSSKSVFDEK